MKWTAIINSPRSIQAKIDQETLTSLTPGVPDQFGFYLYVWENGKGIADDLQDTLEAAKRAALRDYGVPIEVWKEAE